MSYRHGVYTSDIPPSIVPPVEALSGLPVVFGTAPIHLASDPKTHTPVLCYSYQEAVKYLGYLSNFEKYTLCEFMKSHFSLFSVTPVVFINVLDAKKHKTAVTAKAINITEKEALLEDEGVLLTTVVLKTADEQVIAVESYDLAFNDEGNVVITILNDALFGEIKAEYTKIDAEKVTVNDIIGGMGNDGSVTG